MSHSSLNKTFDLKIPIRFLDFVTYIILPRNLAHYPNYIFNYPTAIFLYEEFCIGTCMNTSTDFSQKLRIKLKQ